MASRMEENITSSKGRVVKTSCWKEEDETTAKGPEVVQTSSGEADDSSSKQVWKDKSSTKGCRFNLVIRTQKNKTSCRNEEDVTSDGEEEEYHFQAKTSDGEEASSSQAGQERQEQY